MRRQAKVPGLTCLLRVSQEAEEMCAAAKGHGPRPEEKAAPLPLRCCLRQGTLLIPLMRHQRLALAWMVKRETSGKEPIGGILADDQGLGKTVGGGRVGGWVDDWWVHGRASGWVGGWVAGRRVGGVCMDVCLDGWVGGWAGGQVGSQLPLVSVCVFRGPALS